MTLNDVCKEAAKLLTDIMLQQAGKKVVNKKKLSKFEERLANYMEEKINKDGYFKIDFDFKQFPYDNLVRELAEDCGVKKGLGYIPSNTSLSVRVCNDVATIKKDGYTYINKIYILD